MIGQRVSVFLSLYGDDVQSFGQVVDIDDTEYGVAWMIEVDGRLWAVDMDVFEPTVHRVDRETGLVGWGRVVGICRGVAADGTVYKLGEEVTA